VWLEKMLTRGDYRRSDAGQPFRPLVEDHSDTPSAAARR
jgi:hypothetical protein